MIRRVACVRRFRLSRWFEVAQLRPKPGTDCESARAFVCQEADMTDSRLDRIDHVIADVIAEEHDLEITAFLAGHEPEAQRWAVEVDKLQHIRVLLARLPFTLNIQDTL